MALGPPYPQKMWGACPTMARLNAKTSGCDPGAHPEACPPLDGHVYGEGMGVDGAGGAPRNQCLPHLRGMHPNKPCSMHANSDRPA
jgi:hypothetical protein